MVFNKLMDDIKLYLYPKLVYMLNTISSKWTRLEVHGKYNINNTDKNTPILFAFWHGKLWLPAHYFKGLNYLVLSSLSRDGEYMTRVLEKYRYQIVRGSSSRGGGRALLELIRKIREGNSAFITPDGPTGPIYKVKPGIVYLQEKTDAVIIPIGVAIKHKKTFASWDRLIFPLPGTRAVLVFGQAVYLPTDKSIDDRAFILENAINKVQQRAESLL